MSQFQSLNELVQAGEKQPPRVEETCTRPTATPMFDPCVNQALPATQSTAAQLPAAGEALQGVRGMTQRPPGPRDYWIFDQVVRRRRRVIDLAEDMRLSQGRISQICINVGAWLDRIADECLPGVREEEKRVFTFLHNLRLKAQALGRAPADEDAGIAVSRALCQLAGIEPTQIEDS